MATIANGVFKQLIYAKEQSMGVLQNTAGEGLTSPAPTVQLTNAVANNTPITNQITANGFLLQGQQFTIGSDTYSVASVVTNAGGVTTAITTTPANTVRAYGAGTAVKLNQSAEVLNGGTLISTMGSAITPSLGTTVFPGLYPTALLALNGAVGTNLLTLAGTSATTTIIAIGQKMTFAGDTTVYTVTGATNVATGTSSVTVSPALLTAKSSVAVTFSASETAKYLRRVTSNLDLKKATFKSNEIRTDMQRAILAVGANSVDGTISGELSNKTYADFMAAVVRREFTSAANSLVASAVTSISALAGGTTLTVNGTFPALTNTENTVKIGDVVRITGFVGNPTLNNVNFILTGATTTALTLDLLYSTFTTASSAETAACTLTVVGKKTYIPKANHVKNSFQIEHFYKDIDESELFVGCRPTQMALKLSPSSMSTVDFTFMGQDMKPIHWGGTPGQGTPALNAAPQASTNNAVVSANTGALYLKDSKDGSLVKVGLVTAFDASVNGNGSVAQVIGSVYTPDVFLGALDVTGNMSIYFTDALYRNSFINQSAVSIIAVFRSDASATSDFISVIIPNARLTTASKDDGEKGLILTTPYSALIYDQSVGTTMFEETTIQIQDSAL